VYLFVPSRSRPSPSLLRQQGITLVETLGALFIAALMLLGLTYMINTSMKDIRDQQAAQYQAQMSNAAAQLLQKNYAALAAEATPTTPAVIALNTGTLQLSSFLSANVQGQNAYGQAPCLLVFKPDTGGLDALLVTEGGQVIPDLDLGYIAANSSQGGGSIPSNNNPAGSAYGAFGAWKKTTPNPSSASCSGQETSGGHLVSEVFTTGPSNQNADFLYREDMLATYPDGNAMHAPIYMAQTAVEGGTDKYCGTAVANSTGKITADPSGRVLSCESGVWQTQGSAYWRDPVASVSDLPVPSVTDNVHIGDVALVLDTGIPYEYTANGWHPLMVDNNGNLIMSSGTLVASKLDLAGQNTLGASCGADPIAPTAGQISMDAAGHVLSCQNGVWANQSEVDPGNNDSACVVIMGPSPSPDYPQCSFIYGGPYPNGSNPVYNSANGTYSYEITRTVTLSKPGVISVAIWGHMYDAQCINSIMANGYSGQIQQTVDIVNNDNGEIIATNTAQSPTITDDTVGINENLVDAAAPNGSGYSVNIYTNWANYSGPKTPYSSSYCGSSSVIQTSPVVAGWSINSYY